MVGTYQFLFLVLLWFINAHDYFTQHSPSFPFSKGPTGVPTDTGLHHPSTQPILLWLRLKLFRTSAHSWPPVGFVLRHK